MAVSAIIVFFLSGMLVLNAASGDGLGLTLSVKAAISFMLGLGAVSLQMFIYSLTGAPFTFFGIGAPWAVLTAFILMKGKPAPKTSGGYGLKGYEIPLYILIASQIVYAFIYPASIPVTGWDAWGIWFLKAKVFFIEKGVAASFLTDKNFTEAHLDYPLLVPLSTAWIYTAIGKLGEGYAKLLYPLEFASLLVIFHYSARKIYPGLAAVFTSLLSLTPIVMVHAAGFPVAVGPLYTGDMVGYADLPLAVYILGASAFFYFYMKEGKTGYAVLSALFFALSAWTKNEGLPFALMGMLAFFIQAVRGKSPWAVTGASIGLIILVISPWAAYKGYLKIGSEYSGNLSASVIFGNDGRLGIVIPAFLKTMFLNISLFNFVWWGYAVALALNIRRCFKGPLLFLNGFLFLQFAAYVFVYMITPADIEWHLKTSLERLVLHMAPLAFFIAFLNASMFLDGKGPETAVDARNRL